MKQILLFGAGKSATVLIDYLLRNASEQNWHVTVVDNDKNLIEQKTLQHKASTAIMADITLAEVRSGLIKNSDIVLSMMPAFLHILIATDCLFYGKHLLTASYADDAIKLLATDAKNKGILFLCEMGLDPGIDHMSAIKLIDDIKQKGGEITSFKSHCGGLVAPESDDNPWHYKISWNPRNVVLAGKTGAEYLFNGQVIKETYEKLFDAERYINTHDDAIGILGYYPNRNSLSYIQLYDLPTAKTFIRTTLRYRDFLLGWQKVIDLKLTDETPVYNSDGLTIAAFFDQHLSYHNLTKSLEDELTENEAYKAALVNMLAKSLEQNLDIDTLQITYDGQLKNTDETDQDSATIKDLIAASYDSNKILEQLYFLGIADNETYINKGIISAADALQFIIENKLILTDADKDMVVMQHDIIYNLKGKSHQIIANMVVKGKNNVHTAMAATVGLPLGIAAKLILNGTIKLSGLHIPVIKEIYEPVLSELAQNGIVFSETTM